ncbi:LRR receptor-like serine/threonine-protein kinase GSO1 [Cornus florida]|uniref:LRR receptor-like serine/threonine-protein kinase GSO1 n=1 Tax=Cornus florida TaxID=4283 RepID=UPI00289A2EC9|nr:LRR receptor-like serine/threonine-protein kinase GSO1 [Cornus florida]
MIRYVPINSLLMFLSIVQLVFSQLPPTQINTMLKLSELLKNNSSPDFPWKINSNSDPCLWKGVSCGPNNSSITQLSISGFSLSGSDFWPVLCQIDTLQSIDLSNNHLNEIPNGFITGCGQIGGLMVLNFSRNKLSGRLPTFQGFGVLEFLDLSHNSLNGKIDLQFDGLVGLKSLNLSYNQFSGSVPVKLGQSMVLEELQLSVNNFSGNIPIEISSYRNLSLVDLSANNLSGSIPDSFRNLTKLKILILSANSLSGEIPPIFSTIKTLYRFAANQNNFNGTLPLGLTMYLINLDLSYNKLHGLLPTDFLSNSNLQFLDLSNNSLDGPIPENMSPNLVRLRLGSNSFDGEIPSSFGSLQQLMYLELDNNNLSGLIPPQLGMCQKLALLNLANNSLTGVLPVQLGNLSNLQEMKLQFNKLDGEIPYQITQLQKLLKLNISWNLLSGSIPPSISNLHSLSNLNLQGNNLSGPIPNSIGNLNSLLELQLGMNRLSGNITSLPTNLQIALNLSNNLFEGPIPRILSQLTGLEVLDLSNNSFSGEIPDFLTGMAGLTQVLLSNNQLSGVVPQFKSYVVLVATGNKGLIYAPAAAPQSPPQSPKKKKTVSVAVVVAVAAGVLAVGVVALIALSISKRFYRINDEQLEPEEGLAQPQVIEGNLLTLNGIHRSNIDFTKAMEAVADPSNIFLKTRFSTYYKAIMPSGISYFVKKINWSDKIFQLGSHDKFGEELRILGKLNNSNVMTPLAYVLTSESAYLFYEFAEKGTLFDVLRGSLGNTLDWASRYSIAIGVAQGLAFLHGCSSGPILLLDFSSKSVMLKSPKEPQVGDIELCKVIDPSKSTGSLSTVAGSVGYIPPEYAYTMRVTMAGNVYSFGVILLELVTGKPAVSEGTELAKWVLKNSAQQGKWDHILDFSVSRTSITIRSQMLAVLKIALACVSVSPESRPKMKSVLRMILNAR